MHSSPAIAACPTCPFLGDSPRGTGRYCSIRELDIDDPEQSARLLTVSSMIAGGLSFYGMFVFLIENAPAGTRFPVWIILLTAFAFGFAIWAIGVLLFRRLGIQFWITENERSDDEKPHAD